MPSHIMFLKYSLKSLHYYKLKFSHHAVRYSIFMHNTVFDPDTSIKYCHKFLHLAFVGLLIVVRQH
jgi:hypothetical protein